MAKITTSAIWISTGNVGGRFLNFLATVYLARVLGASNFGLVSIGLSVLGYAVWLSNMGLNTIGTRETAKPRMKREFSPSALLWVRFGAGILVFICSLLILTALPIDGGQKTVIGLFLLSVIPQALLLEWYFTGLQKYREVALGKFVKSSIYLLLIYLVVRVSNDVWWVPLLYLAGSFAAMLFLFLRLNTPLKLLRFNLNREKAARVIRKSLTIGLGSSFNEVVQLLPPIIIGVLISTADAGIYSAAMKVVLVGTLLDRVFVNLFLPKFTSYWSNNSDKAKQIIDRIFKTMLLIGILMSVGFMIASDWLMPLLFGSEYEASKLLLRILSWFLVATFVNSVFAFGLLAINRDRAYLRSMLRGGIAGAILIAGLTAFGKPYWTALAVVFSEFLITGFNYYEFRKTLQPDVFRPVIAGSVSVLLSITLFYSLPGSIYLQLPIILGAVFVTHYLLGGLNNSDIKWIIQTAKR